MVVTGSDQAEIDHLKSFLQAEFTIKDLGVLHYFLGIEVSYVQEGIILSQNKFSQDLLKESVLPSSKPVRTPLPVHLKLTPDQGHLLPDPSHYRKLIGKLNYLMNTRPDLSSSVQYLSQFMQQPTTAHLEALHHVLRYVKTTIDQGILLKGADELSLHAY